MSRTSQKTKCKIYAAKAQRIENKTRNIERADRQTSKAQLKAQLRIAEGKPVRSRHLSRSRGTSKGNMPNGAHLNKKAA